MSVFWFSFVPRKLLQTLIFLEQFDPGILPRVKRSSSKSEGQELSPWLANMMGHPIACALLKDYHMKLNLWKRVGSI